MIWSNHDKVSYLMEPHRHDMHEFYVCFDDHGTEHVGGKDCAFQRGRAFMLYSDCLHQMEFSLTEPSEFIFVCFDRNHLAESGFLKLQEQLQLGQKEQCYFSGKDPEYLESNLRLITSLHEAINSNLIFRDELVNSLLAQLLIAFFRHASSHTVGDLADEKRDRVVKLCHRVASDPALELTLDQAAGRVGVCRSVFAALVKATTGFTWREYVLNCRLGKALDLLTDEKRQISEIALACSFNNIGYFHRCFFRKYGKTPGTVRKILRQNRYPAFIKCRDCEGNVQS